MTRFSVAEETATDHVLSPFETSGGHVSGGRFRSDGMQDE